MKCTIWSFSAAESEMQSLKSRCIRIFDKFAAWIGYSGLSEMNTLKHSYDYMFRLTYIRQLSILLKPFIMFFVWFSEKKIAIFCLNNINRLAFPIEKHSVLWET